MIYLKKLYSESRLFDSVEFKDGINIILGKYSTGEKTKEINGIGKSTLIRLIDYCLLSDGSKAHFSAKKRNFLKGHSCTLVFELDGVDYSIKRLFESTKVLFWRNDSSDAPVEYTEKELRNILGTKFFIQDDYDGVVESGWYRNLINFFIKDDVDYHGRNDPLNFINPSIRGSTLLIYNFFLLGLSNKNIHEFDKNSVELRELRETKNSLEQRAVEASGKKIEDLDSEKIQIEQKIVLLKKGLRDFEFIENYREVQDQLVRISVDISAKLKAFHLFKKNLFDIQNSYKLDLSVDLNKVRRIYNELKNGLGEIIVRPIDDVVLFRKEIAENRRTFLAVKEKEIKDTIDRTVKEISVLESKRSSLYKMLDEKEAMDSIKHTYEELIEQRSKLEQILAVTGKIESLNDLIADLEVKVSKSVKNILSEHKDFESKIKQLQLIFIDFVTQAVGQSEMIGGTYFDVKAQPNKKGPIQITIEVPKSDSLGKSRFKILTYDLTVFFNLINENRHLPRFIIHDGAFHGIDKKTTINVLNYIYKESRKNRFQYIFTANEPEIEIPSNKEVTYGHFDFNIDDSVIVTLEDRPEKMLLKQEFQS